MSERKIHLTRANQTITERGIEQRTDDPSFTTDGQEWFNTANKTRNVYIDGVQKTYAFTGEAGEAPFSTLVKTTDELVSAVSSGANQTVYLKVAEYDLTLGAVSLVTEKSIRLIGETLAQDINKRVRIYTDGSHFVKANPTITTITSNGSVSAVNGSATVNLTAGLWASDLSGQYLFLNGKYYLISSTPTQTQIILSEPYTGPSVASATYFITYMVKDILFENIEFVGKNALHIGIQLRNTINARFNNCRFISETTGMYVKIDAQYTANTSFNNCSFRNYKINFTNDNYEGYIDGCDIKSNVTMGSEYFVKIDTQKGVSPIATNFNIINNTFYGPSSFVSLVSAKQNTIGNNVCTEVLNTLISIDANSNDNLLIGNIINTQSSSSTPLIVNSKYNILANNRIIKVSGYFIDLTASAQYNTVIGNIGTGGAVINDNLPSINYNRIEDDLTRLGSAPTGTSKDLIDTLNGVIQTLQNKPSVLTQQNVSIDSSLTDETFVYWNPNTNQYERADGADLSKDNAYGIITNINGSSGDIQFLGIRTIVTTPSGNPQVTYLYNSGYIGEKFYLGVSGVLIPESLVLTSTSGVPTNQKSMGTLIDIVGGTSPQFLLLPTEEYKYGTPSNYWQLGKSDVLSKYISFGTVPGTISQIVYDSPNKAFLYVKNGNSGEITQPFNNDYLANSINSYKGTGVVSAVSSGAVNVNVHNLFLNGYRKTKSATSVAPIVGYSGDVFIFSDTNTVTVSSGIVNGVLIALEEQSGGIFLTNRNAPVSSFGRIERFKSDDLTPASNSYVELEKVYVPVYKSGSLDVIVTASTQARSSMQSLYPHQIVDIKLQMAGVDVAGTTRKNSLYFVASGEISYTDMHVDKLVNIYTDSGMIKVSLMGRYEYGGSVAPVTFNNTNLRVEI